MAAVQLACPLCHGILEIDSSLAGRQVTCPTCQGVVTIPALDFGEPSYEPPAYAPPLSDPPRFQPVYSELPAAAELAQLACPLCAGAFQITPEMEGQQVACPHCSGTVTIPYLNGSPPAIESLPAFETAPLYSPAPAIEPPPAIGATHPPEESPAEAEQAARQEKDLYPPGFEAPPDIKRSKKKKRPPDQWIPQSASPSPTSAAAKPIESMLPPSAAGSQRDPVPLTSYPPPAFAPTVDSMLPPGAQVALPEAALPPSSSSRPIVVTGERNSGYLPSATRSVGETVVIPTEDGGYVSIHEPVKTVGKPGQEIELRRLTPEEKSRRRLVKNLVMGGFCLVVLVVTFFLLKSMK